MSFEAYQRQFPDLETEDVVRVWVSDMLEESFAVSQSQIAKESGLPLKVVNRLVREVKEQHRKQPDPLVQKQVLTHEDVVMTFMRINRGFVREDTLQRVASLEMIDRLVEEQKILVWGAGYYSLPWREPPLRIQRKFKKMILAEVDRTPKQRLMLWIDRRPPGSAWTADDLIADVGLPKRIVTKWLVSFVENAYIQFVERVGVNDFYRKV
jgi:hypothetical protein